MTETKSGEATTFSAQDSETYNKVARIIGEVMDDEPQKMGSGLRFCDF